MMRFRIIVLASSLVVGVAALRTQQTSESIQDLRHRCFDAMQRSPRSAPLVCTEYLKRSSEDDPRPVKVVSDWLAAYGKVQPYIKALLSLTRPETERSWFVYEPDLSLEIPQVSEKGDYKVELDRSFNSAAEEALLKKAEAVYQSPSKMIEILLRDLHLFADNLPNGNEPLWWIGGNDNVRLTTVVTARAVLHYYDLSRELRRDPAAVPGFPMNQTSLKYHAAIKRYDKYSHGDNNFTDVYVADLNLEWSHSCGGLCGMAFARNKVVILRATGEVLAMYLDAPVNSTFTVS